MLRVFEDDDHYYAVMDVCVGGTLRRFIRNLDDQVCLPAVAVEDS